MTGELKKEWDSILDFPDLYIYGAAKTAKNLYDFILQMGYQDNVKGFLVTDGERNPKTLCELPVRDVHDFMNRDIHVLVPHMGVYKEQISSLLEELSFRNVLLIGRLRERTSLEKMNFSISDYGKIGWELYEQKSEEEKEKDKNTRGAILDILRDGQPDFGGVKPYQSMELIGLEGMRPTEYRIRTYELRQILKKSDAVLDIGCNSGFLDISISELVGSVTGIEYDESLVKIANLTAGYLNVSNCKFYNDDFKKWSQNIEKDYNVIFSFAIHHWLDLSAMEYVDIIDRLLRTDGYLCFESHIYGMDDEFNECYKAFLNLGYHVVCEKKIKDDGMQERMYVLLQKSVN